MTFNPRVKTALACDMARLDRDRFNEAVAAGHYGCAPSTTPGSSRIFLIEDCVALYIYARMIDEGVPPSRAGGFVCEIILPELKSSRANPPEHLLEVRTSAMRFAIDAANFDMSHNYYSGAPVEYRRIWPTGDIRRRIEERLRFEFEESPILGDD